MQLVGTVANTNQLLYLLARRIYTSLPEIQKQSCQEPIEKYFLIHSPYDCFSFFLDELSKKRAELRFIITVDEFEIIEEMIDDQQLEPQLLVFWRGLFQSYQWFVMIFAGCHSLKEMCQDYWNPFLYGSVKSIPISFLKEKAAQELIQKPLPIPYTSEAIDRIISLTNCQPYLIQLICEALVDYYNHQLEEGQTREKSLRLEDVEVVINTPEFFNEGFDYFQGVWGQAIYNQPAINKEILETLSDGSYSLSQLRERLGCSLEEIKASLKILRKLDVIEIDNEVYIYTVELMRRWVQQGSEGVG